MEIAIVILLLTIGAAFGAMLGYIWGSDRRPVAQQLHEIQNGEQAAREAQL